MKKGQKDDDIIFNECVWMCAHRKAKRMESDEEEARWIFLGKEGLKEIGIVIGIGAVVVVAVAKGIKAKYYCRNNVIAVAGKHELMQKESVHGDRERVNRNVCVFRSLFSKKELQLPLLLQHLYLSANIITTCVTCHCLCAIANSWWDYLLRRRRQWGRERRTSYFLSCRCRVRLIWTQVVSIITALVVSFIYSIPILSEYVSCSLVREKGGLRNPTGIFSRSTSDIFFLVRCRRIFRRTYM